MAQNKKTTDRTEALLVENPVLAQRSFTQKSHEIASQHAFQLERAQENESSGSAIVYTCAQKLKDGAANQS